MAGKFKILRFPHGLQIVDHKVGGWVIMTLTKNGALVVKKGSWQVNWRLWKPRFALAKGKPFPKGVPQYVQDEVKEGWKAIAKPDPKDVYNVIA